MTATKKSIRFLTVLALVFAMVLSIASTPVSAAGAQTWYYGSATQPNIEISGSEHTSQRIMGDSGKLTIRANFVPKALLTEVTYTLQIRNYNGTMVKASSSFSSSLPITPLTVTLDVKSNERYMIYFFARYTSTGEPANATATYMYSLEKN